MPTRTPSPVPVLSALALVVTLAVGPAHAQALSELPPGTRVRVTATSPALRGKVAAVVAADSGRLVVTFLSGTKRDTVRIDSTAVSALEVSRGRQRNVARGAAVGLLGGILSGAVMAAAVDTCDRAKAFCFEPTMGEMVVGGALLGLGIGSLASLLAPRERWERWPRPAGRGLEPTIASNGHGGVRLGLRLAAPPFPP